MRPWFDGSDGGEPLVDLNRAAGLQRHLVLGDELGARFLARFADESAVNEVQAVFGLQFATETKDRLGRIDVVGGSEQFVAGGNRNRVEVREMSPASRIVTAFGREPAQAAPRRFFASTGESVTTVPLLNWNDIDRQSRTPSNLSADESRLV